MKNEEGGWSCESIWIHYYEEDEEYLYEPQDEEFSQPEFHDEEEEEEEETEIEEEEEIEEGEWRESL